MYRIPDIYLSLLPSQLPFVFLLFSPLHPPSLSICLSVYIPFICLPFSTTHKVLCAWFQVFANIPAKFQPLWPWQRSTRICMHLFPLGLLCRTWLLIEQQNVQTYFNSCEDPSMALSVLLSEWS